MLTDSLGVASYQKTCQPSCNNNNLEYTKVYGEGEVGLES